jgi:hypothetical protein
LPTSLNKPHHQLFCQLFSTHGGCVAA